MAETFIQSPIRAGAEAGLSAWNMVGTGSQANHEVIDKNLKGVSLICNTFVLGMCCWLIFKLF